MDLAETECEGVDCRGTVSLSGGTQLAQLHNSDRLAKRSRKTQCHTLAVKVSLTAAQTS
jgi:hypothetical protein